MENSASLAVSSASAEAATASSLAEPPPKKKRNLPGMPDPDAEVIALSPKTLMATNRFVCEICSKGFQRDQNLQLHRRGHNLPWKLKQRSGKDLIRRRVYVCPEPTCVHHNPARALGDLTGIKKHFCRKHGEKKWKCERCSKKYAVQSDWKAHMKTCGTKEYKCDCGTLFSRRDSFITHRAFCDALAEESSRAQTLGQESEGNPSRAKAASKVASPPPPPLTPSTTVVSPVLSIQSSDLPENATELLPPAPAVAAHPTASAVAAAPAAFTSGGMDGGFGSLYASSTQMVPPPMVPQGSPSSLSNMVCPAVPSDQGGSMPSPSAAEPTSLSLFLSSTASSIFSRPKQNPHLYIPSPQPTMSATALLQKAAQMGAAASNNSLLRGLGLAMSSTSYSSDTTASMAPQWGSHPTKVENDDSAGHGLGLGLPSHENPGMPPGLVMDQSSLFGTRPTTLDFLGLGMGPSRATTSGLSALLTSLEGGFGGAPQTSFGGRQSSGPGAWDDQPDRKHGGPSFL